MNGQWLETYRAEPLSLGMIDLEDRGDHYQGTAVVYYGDKMPGAIAIITTKDKAPTQSLDLAFTFFEIGTGRVLNDSEVVQRTGWAGVSKTATVTLTMEGRALRVTWHTPTGEADERLVQPSASTEPSGLTPVDAMTTWSQFKEYITQPGFSNCVFRGQSEAHWKLRTAFHRTGRCDMYRYAKIDLQEAQFELASQLDRQFNRTDEIENAAFLHLLQHHGFPTPLLDWSFSPFVAAYFAFERHSLNRKSDHVRIHLFDGQGWFDHHVQAPGLQNSGPHLSLLRPKAIGNPRSGPQQSMSTYTNIDDIEWFVAGREKFLKRQFLFAIDLPYEERHRALHDLSLMGISAATLFPDMDGVCRNLRWKIFGYDA